MGYVNSKSIRLFETFRIVFYTPIYVSLSGGFWNKQGLDISFSTCPPEYPHPLSALRHQVADVVQSGIMRSIISLDWGASTVPLHFAKINSGAGFFVLRRQSDTPFQWQDMNGAKVIPVGFSPMPWASFQYALRAHNIEPTILDILHKGSLQEALDTFIAGEAEFVHVPEPTADYLITEHGAEIAIPLGSENGHIAYSSFASNPDYLDKNPENIQKFYDGFGEGLKWLSENPPEVVAESIKEFFPDASPEALSRSISRYKYQSTWPTNPKLNEPEYQGLQTILMNAGLVKERQAYDRVVSEDFFN